MADRIGVEIKFGAAAYPAGAAFDADPASLPSYNKRTILISARLISARCAPD
jgi:hypothetical protein